MNAKAPPRWREMRPLGVSSALLFLVFWQAACTPNSTPANNPPVADAGVSQAVDAGAAVTLDGTATTDPEGDLITFSWKQIMGVPVVQSSTTAPVVTFTAPSTGTTLVFELTASDAENSAVATTTVTVRPTVDGSAKIEELTQRSIGEDPAVQGIFPDSWLVLDPVGSPPPADESELAEFNDQLADTQFAPLVEEDLAGGATRTLDLNILQPSGLTGTVRWIGTTSPLTVTLSLDGTVLVTGTDYQFGNDRGGTLIHVKTTAAGLVTLAVTNTADTTVKVHMVFAAGVPAPDSGHEGD